uniref:NS protein n=8 Tax=Equine parvovirus H TaxID=2079554 RepID=A0A650G1N3_9VIRU|nr:NS protein [Equine parvovirus H]
METFWYGVVNAFADPVKSLPGCTYEAPFFNVALTSRSNQMWDTIQSSPYANCARLGEWLFQLLRRHISLHHRQATEPALFLQAEKAEGDGGRLHIHYVVSTSLGNPRECRALFNAVEVELSATLLRAGLQFFLPRKNKNGGWQSCNEDFIVSYLLPKQPPHNAIYAWTNMSGLVGDACLNKQVRATLKKERPSTSGNIGPIHRAVQGDKFRDLVDHCIENFCFNDEDLRDQFPECWFSFACTTTGLMQLKQAFKVVESELPRKCSAGLAIVRCLKLDDVRRRAQQMQRFEPANNKVCQLLTLQGYDWQEASCLFWAWSTKQTGKRNAIWLTGEPTTGKTLLASAIANAVKHYGCVNWTNENFPFNDIPGKLLAWWEEGAMSSKVVEAAKALMSGASIRIDRKNNDSTLCRPPPFIITSNGDITVVTAGNVLDFSHQQALEDRMFKFTFENRLQPDFGIISTTDVQDFFLMGYRLLNVTHPDNSCLKQGVRYAPHVIPKRYLAEFYEKSDPIEDAEAAEPLDSPPSKRVRFAEAATIAPTDVSNTHPRAETSTSAAGATTETTTSAIADEEDFSDLLEYLETCGQALEAEDQEH